MYKKSRWNYYLPPEVTVSVKEWLAGKKVDLAITLGSGLGGFGREIPNMIEIPYQECHLPVGMTAGHSGILRYAEINGHGTLILDGRVHLYEGFDVLDVVMGVRAAFAMGAKTQIITCATGGVKFGLKPGSLVIIKDHLNLTGANPLQGVNYDNGPRFPDMSTAYDQDLRILCKRAGHEIGMHEIDEGVLAAMPGPNYETPAEVRMLRTMGADMAGMSTVPEVLALRHLGARVLGISCVANHAAGVTDRPLSHTEVVTACNAAAPKFRQLITKFIELLPVPE